MPKIPSRKPKKIVKPAKKKAAPKRKAAKKLGAVAVTMVVDESGSMAHLFDATVAGFNEYVATLKNDMADQPVYISTITFDSSAGRPTVRCLQTGVELRDALTLSRHNYKPNGGTPLLDAVGDAITITENVQTRYETTKQIVVIQTDGENNASTRYNLAAIKSMVEARQARGWQFVFIGAGLNAFLAGTEMGISAMNTVSYAADEIGTQNVFRATAANSRMFSSGDAQNMQYSALQSVLAGESQGIWNQKMAAAQGAPAKKQVNITIKS